MKYYRPVVTSRITQYFGQNLNNFYAQLGLKGHNGIDYGTITGTEVRWPGSGYGEVVQANDHPTYGKRVVVKCKNDGTEHRHYFGHLQDWTVKEGQIVETGQLLGHTDNTGLYTTGPHCHWGIYPYQNGAKMYPNNGYEGAIDPMEWYEDRYVMDVMTELMTQEIGLLKRVINFVKNLINLKK